MDSLIRYLDTDGPPSPKALEGDVEFLNSLGFPIFLAEADGRRYFVDSAARHLGAKEERAGLNHTEKQAIAMAAVSLILGLPNRKPDSLDEEHQRKRLMSSNPELDYLWTWGELLDFQKDNDTPLVASNARKLREKLNRLWKESNLTIFADAGTTNDHMGQVIKDVLLPTAFSHLRNLQVCTNGRILFNTIADAEVCAKGIITGGYQLGVDGSTDSIAGGYTEAFLRATEGLLRFGVCFVGCTAVDAVEGYLLSDSFEEKTVKEIVMSPLRSRIRVVNVDRTKFEDSPMREGFRFANINPEQIDLIITTRSNEIDKAHSCINRIRSNMGVPVIEVPLPQKSPASRFADMISGREIRARMDFTLLEELLYVLGLAIEEPSRSGSAGESGRTANARILPTKYVSRSVEMFLSAAVEFFLHDSSPEARPVKDRMLKIFKKYREASFLAPTDSGGVSGE